MKTIINIGTIVVCDFCNSEDESKGGVMIGSHAVCGKCTERRGYDKPDYEHKDEISKIFDKKKTFKENVLEYRHSLYGSRNGVIEIMPFDKFEEVINKTTKEQ